MEWEQAAPNRKQHEAGGAERVEAAQRLPASPGGGARRTRKPAGHGIDRTMCGPIQLVSVSGSRVHTAIAAR